MSKSRSRRKSTRAERPQVETSFVDHSHNIATCQRILRSLTGAMIGAFILIVVLTTFSVGEPVQIIGRGLYFIILASVVVSLAVWAVRVRFEREMGKNTHVAAEVLKRV